MPGCSADAGDDRRHKRPTVYQLAQVGAVTATEKVAFQQPPKYRQRRCHVFPGQTGNVDIKRPFGLALLAYSDCDFIVFLLIFLL